MDNLLPPARWRKKRGKMCIRDSGNVEHTAAGGFGPVHALDRALRRALTRWYPELEQMHQMCIRDSC